jgi:hypothetical protein
MTDDDITLHRETMKIEGDRNLYSYTFTDQEGRVVPHEHSPKAKKEAEGNLTSTEGEIRKG